MSGFWALKDLTGRRFGRLTVLCRDGSNASGLAVWLCRCTCGTVTRTAGNLLRAGKAVSCGCYKRENSARVAAHLKRKHGMHGSRTYRSWRSMKTRCTNPTHISYKNYGSRGITICTRWLRSFECFLADLGERPPGTSLDRIDVNGNYEPGNCKWSTPGEQSRNTRRSITYKRAPARDASPGRRGA